VQEKLAAGASLVQLYTGFVYEGPAVVKRMNRAIK
jgi:dihydroorotate dehydrogenase